jgi:Mrp family chromosome partitioning ATPase
MTMLDRAFVKAYQQRQQAAGAASSDAAPVVSPQSAGTLLAEPRRARPLPEQTAAEQPPAEQPRAEEPPDEQPPTEDLPVEDVAAEEACAEPTPVAAASPAPSPDAAELTPVAASPALVDAFSQGPALSGRSQILQPAPRRAANKDVDAERLISRGGATLRVRVDRGELPSAPSLSQLGDLSVQPFAGSDLLAAPVDAPERVAAGPAILATQPKEMPETPAAPAVAECDAPADTDATTPADVEALWSAVQAIVDPPFVPGYQVDYLVWPAVCRRLGEKASAELDQLADALIGYDRRRHRVLGICSGKAGAGATTVAQCLAARLVQAGMRVVLVDGSCRSPRLAERFGLAPDSGWEQATGPARSVADLLVESARDQMAVLPRRDGGQATTLSEGHIEHLRQLRSNYDVVLVDLGLLDDMDFASSAMPSLAACLDWMVIVDDVRGGKHDIARQAERLRQAGVRELGVVENFAADCGLHRL